jgi:hypothetical protein
MKRLNSSAWRGLPRQVRWNGEVALLNEAPAFV